MWKFIGMMLGGGAVPRSSSGPSKQRMLADPTGVPRRYTDLRGAHGLWNLRTKDRV